MKAKLLLVIALVAAWVLVGMVHAQEQQQQTSSPGVSQSPGIDNQGIRNYLLGPGDVLDVRVFGQPDLSSTNQVDSDGNLSSLPFLETPIPARCRTEKQVQKDIATAYAKFINAPQVSVRISERNSHQPATVFGAVRQPTRVEMKRKVRLNELMAVSGGFTERASGTIQILHTEPLMCPAPGEEAEALPIDGTRIPLQIFKISELRSGKLAVKIYRQKLGSSEQEIINVDYAAIKKNQKPDVWLQPYDVIEVPEASAFSSKRIGSTVLNAISGGMTSAISTSSAFLPTRVLY